MRARWNSQLGFLLSSAGSAIGLGNIWKFPYITGVNGGGLFVIFYLLCIIFVAFPVLIAEITIGQKSQANAIKSFRVLEKKRTIWSLAGAFGLLATILIFSFYSVVGGWILYYMYSSIFAFESFASQATVDGLFTALMSNFPLALGCQWAFLLLTVSIVVGGVNKGIEKVNKILLPLLLLLLLTLLGYACTLPGFGQAVRFLFSLDVTHFSARGMLEAVGHSFFTISVGVGIMITYGSYLAPKERVAGIAGTIIIADTIVALISGLIVFAIVFSNNAEVAQGPVLIFKTLPILFYQMAGGYWVAPLFFILVTFTALTSTVSLVEVPVAFLIDAGLSRRKSVSLVLLVVTLLGSLCALSFGSLANFLILKRTVFDLCDEVSTKILLPVSGLLCVLYFSYKMNRAKPTLLAGIFPNRQLAQLFRFAANVFAPISIVIILVFGLMN